MRTTGPRGAVLRRAAGRGALAGLAGAAPMTAGEEVEQALTSRPPAGNRAMHHGTGVLRGVWAAVGLRGPRAHLAHTATRLGLDRTVENTTGVGASPESTRGRTSR